MAEAKLLRQHKGRLEARMQILEDHNRQLEAQLQRLRQLLDEPNNGGGVSTPGSALNSKPNTLQTRSVTASQLNTDSPAKMNQQNGHYDQNTSEYSVIKRFQKKRKEFRILIYQQKFRIFPLFFLFFSKFISNTKRFHNNSLGI